MKTLILSIDQVQDALLSYIEEHELAEGGKYDVKLVFVHEGKKPIHVRVELEKVR